jgi:hypothetical protein
MCTYPKNHFSSLHRPLLPATHPSPPNPEPRVAPALYAALRNMKQNKARRKKERNRSEKKTYDPSECQYRTTRSYYQRTYQQRFMKR